MTQHTPGRMRVAEDGSLGSIESESGMSIGQTFQTRPIRDASDHEERKANARRLVACWNMLTDFTTERIEADDVDWQMLRTQRDELLDALKVVLRDYAAVHDIGDVEMQPAIYQARAAIAKVEQNINPIANSGESL